MRRTCKPKLLGIRDVMPEGCLDLVGVKSTGVTLALDSQRKERDAAYCLCIVALIKSPIKLAHKIPRTAKVQ